MCESFNTSKTTCLRLGFKVELYDFTVSLTSLHTLTEETKTVIQYEFKTVYFQ